MEGISVIIARSTAGLLACVVEIFELSSNASASTSHDFKSLMVRI